jgi:hypothetical protein
MIVDWINENRIEVQTHPSMTDRLVSAFEQRSEWKGSEWREPDADIVVEYLRSHDLTVVTFPETRRFEQTGERIAEVLYCIDNWR